MKTNLTAMTKSQIANFYGIHRKTLVTRCKKVGVNLERGLIMPRVILQIFEVFGDPRVD
jgi:hypothetical protein